MILTGDEIPNLIVFAHVIRKSMKKRNRFAGVGPGLLISDL